MFWKAGADATMLPKPTTAPNTRADVAAAPALSANKLLNIAASEFPRYLRFNIRQMMNAKAIPDVYKRQVTDRHWLNGRTLYEVVKESLDGGVTFLQLREKTLDEAHFLEEAKELQKLCKEYKVPFIINDNVDIAVAMNADGVHVGQSDMEAGDVRAKLGPRCV